MRAILYDTIAKLVITRNELPLLARSFRPEDLTFHGPSGLELVFVVKNPERYLDVECIAQAKTDRDLQASFAA